MTDGLLRHVTTGDDWLAAQERGAVSPPSLGTEGFVHCSTAEQVDGVIERFYADVADLLVLTVDPALLDAELRWEAPAHPDGSPVSSDEAVVRFPHVYGPIPVAAVVEAVPYRRTA